MAWKTPKDYVNTPIYYVYDDEYEPSCNYDTREEVGCTEIFLENGFLKNLRWDRYVEYNLLCKNCPHYYHDVGIYFGDGHATENIKEKSTVWCWCTIKNHDAFCQAVSAFPDDLKTVVFSDVRTENLAELERFTELECVLISSCPKLEHFWDFSKTPELKVLEYMANTHLTDLSEISKAKGLEYFGIETLTSNVNLVYVDSFAPLKKLSSLKEVSFSSVMCSDNNIDDLIDIPNLEKLWISPHTFSTESFAKFEAIKFKIYKEYGIYQNGEDYIRPLGKGGRCFRSEKSKAAFSEKYAQMMKEFQKEE